MALKGTTAWSCLARNCGFKDSLDDLDLATAIHRCIKCSFIDNVTPDTS